MAFDHIRRNASTFARLSELRVADEASLEEFE
jgi:hypothetical protein